jgi:hypothetical protein
MKRFAAILAFTAMLAYGSGPASALTTASPYPIHVTNCDPQLNESVAGFAPGFYPGSPYYWRDVYGYRYYQPPYVTSNPQLAIEYTNVTDKVIARIQFGLVANGHLVAEVRDVGTFSPNAEIKHSFGISRNVFPLQTGLPRCVALHVTYADGTVWRNPHLPALRRSLYEASPQP